MSTALGDKKKYDYELNKYKNENIKKKADEQILSFERNMRLFRYKAIEIIGELESMYNFVVQYYARYILELVNKYQTFDKNSVKEVYEFLIKKIPESENLELKNDYDKYTKSKFNHNICLKKISQSTKDFILQIGKIYDDEKIIKELCEKNIHERAIKYIDNRNFNDLFQFAYENNLEKLFIFLYLFANVSFDYQKIIGLQIQPHNNQINNAHKIETKSGGNVGCNMMITESKERIEIHKKMMYLRRYSKMINPHSYVFCKKYINSLNDEVLNIKICDYESIYTYFSLHS
jgi:hypothetical protein